MPESAHSTSRLPAVLQPTSNLAPPPTDAEFKAALAKGRANVREVWRSFLPFVRSSNRYR